MGDQSACLLQNRSLGVSFDHLVAESKHGFDPELHLLA